MIKIKPECENLRTLICWGAFIVLFLVGAGFRLAELDRAPFRADELNQYIVVVNEQRLVDLWRNPPWLNQIPSVETLSLVVAPFLSETPSEFTIRLPFALFGIGTLLLCALGVTRVWGGRAGLLLLLWMSLNPFHLYESREAYYYVLVMFFSAGSIWGFIEIYRSAVRQGRIPARQLWFWGLWLAVGCHIHMSFWIFAAIQWGILFVALWRHLSREERGAHSRHLLFLAAGMLLIMSRWIFRAFKEIITVSDRGGHLGAPSEWVLPRLVPMFLAGANWVGVLLLVVVLLAATFSLKALWRQDIRFKSMTILLIAGLGGGLLYIGFLGRGAAKFTYFSAYWPLLMIWVTALVAHTSQLLNARLSKLGDVTLGLLCLFLIGTLVVPASHIVRLDGKPTPYKKIKHTLDAVLPPGSVVVVDRWFEPWNEMALYAPTNVFVTFTVPDEPYAAFIQNRWRDVTRQYIEEGRAQGFLMLTKNHWEQAGVWEWPESYFARMVTIENPAGLWLREHGFVSGMDFYEGMTNRLVVNLYYDLPEDRVARSRAKGQPSLLLLGPEWGYEKPWRATGNMLADYRTMHDVATLTLYNLRDEPASFDLVFSATGHPNTMRIAFSDGRILSFPTGQMTEHRYRLDLSPGETKLRLRALESSRSQLFASDIQLMPVP